MVEISSLPAVAGLAAVHLFSGRLRFLDATPRSVWLSVAGGVSVAYVFVHLLPELGEGQEVIADAVGEELAFVEAHVYLVALLGLAAFHGLERAARSSRRRKLRAGEEDATSPAVFWLHAGSFAIYNALIGYLLIHRIDSGPESLLLFFIAMALHFLVNDRGLREHHKDLYGRLGRWLLAGAVLIGWIVGFVTEIPEAAIAVLVAFLAGGVILNVLKEELPEERESRFRAFVSGTIPCAALLLALYRSVIRDRIAHQSL